MFKILNYTKTDFPVRVPSLPIYNYNHMVKARLLSNEKYAKYDERSTV